MIMMLAVVAMAFVVGCNDDDKMVESQRNTIERYLTSSHQPRLIPESEIENSLEFNPPFYEKLSQNVYRYIATYYNADRDLQAEVEMGDLVELTATAYIFTGSAPSTRMVYYTNDAAMISSLVKEGLDDQYWSAEPMVVRLGETDIIKGVELSLLECREGDRVEAYMTHEAAYGKDPVGLLPKESAVLWVYSIDKVTKR